MYRFDAAEFSDIYAKQPWNKDKHVPSLFVLDAIDKVNREFLISDGEQRFRTDNSDTIYFARQLEFIESRLYPVDVKVLKYRRHIPVDNAVDPGAQVITYRMYEPIGMAVIISNPSMDLPRVDVVAQEYSAKVKNIGASYGFSTDDVRRARFANMPLDQFKVAAAQRAFNETENRIAWLGDAASGLIGFLNNPNVPLLQSPNNGSGSSRLWSQKTPSQIIADVASMVNQVKNNTLQARSGDTLLLTQTNYTLIATTVFTAVSGGVTSVTPMTILDFILKNESFGIREVDAVLDLAGAGPGTTDVALFYEKNPEVIQQRITLERIMHPMQPRNLEFVVPCEAKNAGVTIRFPIATLEFYGY